MENVPTLVLILALLVLGLSGTCRAWYDSGHMTAAAIAQRQLTPGEIEALETPLRRWSDEFSGVSSLITSSIWADRVRCRPADPFCAGMPSFPALNIFSAWHYITIPYNPHRTALSSLAALHPLPQTGVVWLLSTLFPTWANGTASSPNSSGEAMISPPGTPSPPFHTWNLKLRFLLHMFGDLHQPLHAATAFSEQFPAGDMGGNRVVVDLSKSQRGAAFAPDTKTLHALWDNCGGLFTENWPAFSEADALSKADELMRMIPYATVSENVLNKTNFQSVAEESYHLATTVAYSELYPGEASKRSSGPAAQPYSPSDAYLGSVQSTCQQRIAVAGYRLARILKVLAADIQTTLRQRCIRRRGSIE